MDKTYERWGITAANSLIAVCTLVDGQHFKSFEQLKKEFDLENGDFFQVFTVKTFL